MLRFLPQFDVPTFASRTGDAMFGLGYGEIALILILGLFLFGGYLPGAARTAGKAVASVRTEARKIKETVNPLA